MAVTVTRKLTERSAFGRQLAEAGQDKVDQGLHAVGADAVRRADELVRKLYDTTRTGYELKDPSDRLEGSFYYEIDRHPGEGLPSTLHLKSSADPHKVGALEFGSPAHTINASDAPLLVFEQSPQNVFGKRLTKRLGPAKGLRQKGRALANPRTGALVKTPSVQHPGNREGRFMRTALESAIQHAYRQAIKLKV